MGFKYALLGALTAGLVGLAVPVQASPILLGTAANPTGINGLDVSGTTYNVTFSTTTLNSFTTGSTLSTNADLALVAALNSLNVVGLAGASERLGFILDVDNSLTNWEGPFCGPSPSPGTCPAGTWLASTDSGSWVLGQNFTNLYYVMAADFSVAPPVTGVPEPMTLSLFAAGLLGVGALRRKRKAA